MPEKSVRDNYKVPLCPKLVIGSLLLTSAQRMFSETRRLLGEEKEITQDLCYLSPKNPTVIPQLLAERGT